MHNYLSYRYDNQAARRVRPPTRLSCSRASIGKRFSLWALQPVASVAGRDACRGMRLELDRAVEKMLGTWDRRWSIVKLSVKPSSRNPISRAAFGFRRSGNDRSATNFLWLFRNRDNENKHRDLADEKKKYHKKPWKLI